MFGKKAAKRAKEEAARLSALATKREEEAAKPTPLQSAEDAANLNFINWENGLSGPIDVTKAPGMGADLDLYNRAASEQDEDRQGIGLLRMGAEGSPAGLVSLIRQNRADRRRQAAGGALAEALRARSARAHGYVLPSTQVTQSRTLGLASLAGGRAETAEERAARLAMTSGFFNSNLFNQIMAGARTAASSGMMGGGGRP